VILPGHVEDFVIESVLSGNLFGINEPLVAVLVDGRVGHGRAAERSLKEWRGNND
jgi:hypothetical protein